MPVPHPVQGDEALLDSSTPRLGVVTSKTDHTTSHPAVIMGVAQQTF